MRTLSWRAGVEIGLELVLLILFLMALVGTRGLSADGRLFPLVVTLAGLPVILGALGQTMWRVRRGVWEPADSGELPRPATSWRRRPSRRPSAATGDALQPSLMQSVRFWLWFGGFCVSLWGFGFYIGLPVMSGLFVLVDGRKSVVKAALTGFLVWAFMYGVFTRGFGIIWPAGAIF